jgi:hypothetical protein
MNAMSKLTVTLALLSGTAYAQDPPTNDTSDIYSNTGMGFEALYAITTTTSQCFNKPYVGCGNTAAGYFTLASTTAGNFNTAIGESALVNNTSGSFNNATGYGALAQNTVSGNTADGANALENNTTGTLNTAVGYQALMANGTSGYNTAVGYNALTANTGSFNAAVGALALATNTSGGANTALGNSALNANQSGGNNTATGSNALYMNDSENTGASGNTADGAGAMNNNIKGSSNTAVGWQALQGTPSGASGSNNTGIGVNALYKYSTGSNNIAVGYEAGNKITSGDSNIDIGNEGLAGDGKTIRIGTEGTHTAIYIAGIYNTSVTGSAVMVNSSGQLGAVVSSERFKTAIAPMGMNTAKLQQLRPVTFKLTSDAKGTVQYGLIAEQVARVYPELVIRDSQGRIDGVRYDELAPMLLNEMQKDHATVATLVAQHAADAAKIASLEQQLAGIRAALVKLQPKDQLVAQR